MIFSKYFAAPIIFFVLFCLAYIPRLPGAISVFTDWLNRFFGTFDKFFFPLLIVPLAIVDYIAKYPFIGYPVALVALVTIVLLLRYNYTFVYVILVSMLNVFCILLSLFIVKTVLIDEGLHLLTESANPLIDQIENYHKTHGRYPESLKGFRLGYPGRLTTNRNTKQSLTYKKIGDISFELGIELPVDIYCKSFFDSCAKYSLTHYSDKKPDTKHCIDSENNSNFSGFGHYIDCYTIINSNWYIKKTIRADSD